MAKLEKINRRWQNLPAVVAAPGPSLTIEVADAVRASAWRTVACQDAYKLMPWADILYGCDARWWAAHDGVTHFAGERWSSHNKTNSSDDKMETADTYGLRLVRGEPGSGYSTDQSVIHYNDNSGAQAVNLAILLGATYIVLVGFDLRHVDGKSHFFGDHPSTLHQRNSYHEFVKKFGNPPNGVTIVNATPNSALRTYPMVTLDEAISTNYRLRRNGAELDALAD